MQRGGATQNGSKRKCMCLKGLSTAAEEAELGGGGGGGAGGGDVRQ